MGPNPVLKENQEKPETKWTKGSCEPRARFPTGAIPTCGKEFRKNLKQKAGENVFEPGDHVPSPASRRAATSAMWFLCPPNVHHGMEIYHPPLSCTHTQ